MLFLFHICFFPGTAVVKLYLWIAEQAVQTSQDKYKLPTVGKEPWESVLVQVFREADAKIGLNMPESYYDKFLWERKWGRSQVSLGECPNVMQVWPPMKERGREEWEGAAQNALQSQEDPPRPLGSSRTRVSSHSSPHALSHWWEQPLGGVAFAQTQQRYLGPLFSFALCSWSSVRPILVATSERF